MTDREKVIKGLEQCIEKLDTVVNKTHGFNCTACPYFRKCDKSGYLIGLPLMRDALALLKAQDQDIATIQPKRIELADETKAWLDEMDAVDALGNIADICIDWDGYRTANDLGGLINEIWAYARYCADKLLKAQEPCEDAVSREAVINITAETGALETQARIKQLPSVQPVPVPRVMMLEEADKAPYVWLESDQGGLGVRRVRIVPEDSTAVCIMAFGLRTTFHESGNFEKHFRCWSEKPSDELRKGTLWTQTNGL